MSPLPLFTGKGLFEFCFDFAKKFDYEIAEFRACGVNDSACTKLFLDSSLKYKYFVGQFVYTYCMSFNIPFKGRTNRSSIVNVVSYFACGVRDRACIVHVHALAMSSHEK
jgi:hypothetical protein